MAEEEDADDAHEDDGEVVLLSPSGLVVDGHLRCTLTASRLTELNVLVNLEQTEKNIVDKKCVNWSFSGRICTRKFVTFRTEPWKRDNVEFCATLTFKYNITHMLYYMDTQPSVRSFQLQSYNVSFNIHFSPQQLSCEKGLR